MQMPRVYLILIASLFTAGPRPSVESREANCHSQTRHRDSDRIATSDRGLGAVQPEGLSRAAAIARSQVDRPGAG